MIGKAKRALCLLAALCLLLGGCWDNREPKRRAFAIGMGIDASERQDGWLAITLQIPVPHRQAGGAGGGGEAEAPADYYWATGHGPTIFAAVHDIQNRVSRELFFGQLRSLVISSELSAEQLEGALEALVRNPDIEETIYMVLTEGSALEVMQIRTAQERFPALYLNSVFEAVRRDTVSLPVKLWEFWRPIHTPGWEPILPVATRQRDELSLAGLAIFKGTEYRGKLSEFESEGYTYFMGRTATGNLKVDIDGGVAMIRSMQSNQDLQVYFEQGRPVFSVSIDVTGELARPPGSQVYTETELQAIESSASKRISQRIDAMLQKVQQEYQSDVLGFGRLLYYRYPVWFESVDWDDMFPEVQIRFDVNMNITRQGLLSQAQNRGWSV